MSQEPKVTRFGALPLIDSEVATKAYVDSSGGGGQTFGRKVKKLDQSVISSTTFVDDDELFQAINADKTYTFHLNMYCITKSVSDVKLRLVIPVGAVAFWFPLSELWRVNHEATVNAENSLSVTGAANDVNACISQVCRVINGANAGDVQLQFAQVTSDANNTTIQEGSLMVSWEEIA